MSAMWLSGVAGFVLMLELLFRLLPVSTSTETGYYTDPLVVTYPAHHRWTRSTGWDLRSPQTVEANNAGYLAGRDFERNNRAVALIGDSYVEASMLGTEDRPGAQLERALGSRPVYAMGVPGTALLDYAERIRFAHVHFDVQDFVLLVERGDVRQSLCGSANVHGRCLDSKTLAPRVETLPEAGMAKRTFRHSALAQYLFSQLKFSPQKLLQRAKASLQPLDAQHTSLTPGPPSTESTGTSSSATPEVDAVTNEFFARITPHLSGHLVIVMDSDRNSLYLGKVTPDPERARFIELARMTGARVIDAKPLFEAHMAQSPLKVDVGPYDGHLNALGIGLVTKAAAKALLQP